MYRRDDSVRLGRQEAVEQMATLDGVATQGGPALNDSGAGTFVAANASASWVHNEGSKHPPNRTYQEGAHRKASQSQLR
jgi:hypothetical protein